MGRRPLLIALVLLALGGPSRRAAASDFAYRLETGREAALLGGAAVLLGSAWLLNQQLEGYEAADQADFVRRGPGAGLDAGARRRWSPTADTLSDWTVRLNTAGPLVQAVVDPGGDRAGRLLLMYGETAALTSGANQLFKVLLKRPRPYLYNDDPRIDAALRGGRDARRSMPSGHAASSFAAAVHFSMVHQELAGGSAWAWGGSLAVASATAFLRVAAGKHHPTDVAAGAALGAFIGWLVPTLHEADEDGAPPTGAPLISFGGRF